MVFSEGRSLPDAAPGVFDMTLKSFDVEAINLKRGFKVKQTLNGLRSLGHSTREARKAAEVMAGLRVNRQSRP
jgi:hypothetical protein